MAPLLLALVCCLLLAPHSEGRAEALRSTSWAAAPLPGPQPVAPPASVTVGIWYGGPGALPPATAMGDPATIARDLAAVRRAGFNAITTWINWREAEPARGSYSLAQVERLIAAAAQADLKVAVRVFAGAPPPWAKDAADDRRRFLAAVTSRLRKAPQVMSVEPAEPVTPATSPIRVGKGAKSPAEARLEFWALLARGPQPVMFVDAGGGVGAGVLSLGETAGIVTRNPALFAPLRPRAGGVRGLTGASGAPVEVTLLESPEVLMIVGLNYSPAVRKVTINFSPDIPEAIWQNLETGTAVSFVMGKGGPFLEHTFSSRDTLVLMIRKTLR